MLRGPLAPPHLVRFSPHGRPEPSRISPPRRHINDNPDAGEIRMTIEVSAQPRLWWHELNTWEPEQACRFYSMTLGWDFSATPLADGAPYWVAHKDGRAVGGVFQLTAPQFAGIPSHWMTYLAVPDIIDAQLKAESAGGEILRPSFHLSGVGRLSVVTDSTGAIIGLIEPDDFGQGDALN
jgi:hypothetical protein